MHLCGTVVSGVPVGDLNDYQRSYVNHGGKCQRAGRAPARPAGSRPPDPDLGRGDTAHPSL